MLQFPVTTYTITCNIIGIGTWLVYLVLGFCLVSYSTEELARHYLYACKTCTVLGSVLLLEPSVGFGT